MVLLLVLSQSCLFEAKSENRLSENQWVVRLNFPVFGNLRQNSHAPREHHDPWKSNLQGSRYATYQRTPM